MSEQQKEFIEELTKRFDDKYERMQRFFFAVIGVILSASLIIGYTQVSVSAANKRQVEINTQNIKFIMENTPSIKAIDRLITTFDNQTRIMEQYLPEDVQGAIKEFNKTSSELRGQIMLFNSNLTTRGVEIKDRRP